MSAAIAAITKENEKVHVLLSDRSDRVKNVSKYWDILRKEYVNIYSSFRLFCVNNINQNNFGLF